MTMPTWIDDYHAFAAGQGAIRLEGWSSLVAAGTDASTLLNNFCTNDILQLEVDTVCEAFFPNAKGKVLAFGWVWRTGETAYRVVLGSGRAGELATHLDRYVIREDVTLAVSDEPLAITTSADGLAELPALGNARLLLDATGAELAHEAFVAYRLEHAMPLDAIDVDDRNLPQELGRDATAISFTKGCYLGQETVARIDALGHVNQQLVLLQLDGEVALGASLMADEKEVGRVTSVAWSPQHGRMIAIGYLNIKYQQTDVALTCDGQPLSVIG